MNNIAKSTAVRHGCTKGWGSFLHHTTAALSCQLPSYKLADNTPLPSCKSYADCRAARAYNHYCSKTPRRRALRSDRKSQRQPAANGSASAEKQCPDQAPSPRLSALGIHCSVNYTTSVSNLSDRL